MEVTSTSERKWRLSKRWIRPISHRDDGALDFTESRITVHGHQPQLYDILEIDLHGKANVDGQPENWLIEEGAMWRKKGHFGTDVIANLVEKPADLWLEEPNHPDRVSPEYLIATSAASLLLIKPDSFRIYLRNDPFGPEGKKKRRAIFTYRGTKYDLALTDPHMEEKYFPRPRQRKEGWVEPGPDSVAAICVSLTPVLKSTGYHYKLAAAVFE